MKKVERRSALACLAAVEANLAKLRVMPGLRPGSRMKEVERRTALACLAAVEANLAELRQMPEWWCQLGDGRQQLFREFESDVRAYQRALQSMSSDTSSG